MSYIFDPYYDTTPMHDKMKPRQLLKIPYDFSEHGFKPIDEYIRLSPALDYLKTVGCLVVMSYHNNTLFYCDCAIHFAKVKKLWSESLRYLPLVFFEDYIKTLKKKQKTAPVMKEGTKLRTMLDELQNSGTPCKVTIEQYEEIDDKPKPEKDSKQKAEDILDLIRKRQNKKKK